MIQQQEFNIPYGLASVNVTSGLTVVTTTGAYYHGMTVIASATRTFVYVWDNASATTGNRLDLFAVKSTGDVWIDKYIPVVAKNGITVGVTGTGAVGTIYYSPKG